MEVRPVDPRDEAWGLADPPAFRVYFWRQPPAPPGIRQEEVMWHAYEYEITGADVAQVLAWAEVERRDRTFTLYVCIPDGRRGLGLIQLCGVDPTQHDTD
ncbi:hypothetical protein [Actinopolymorpha sp. B9G3]|uniref:hypothetical protein n=1 Tax=Actinopolymorpha sp. B9G3 TaxID=3158970 RepID=UPI0032D93111